MSSLKHVIDGDGDLLHLRSLTCKISDKDCPFEVDGEEFDDNGSYLVSLMEDLGSPEGVRVTRKFVFTFQPLIRIVALS